MDSILSAMNEYRIILGAIVLTLVAYLLMKAYWKKISFSVLRIRMNMPVFGKINALAKNPARDESGWFHSERDLCGAFEAYYKDTTKDADFYDNCVNYLSKVGELGRKNLGFFGWLVISVMVFIEAMGLAYVLAGYAIPGASESLQQEAAIALAFAVSVLLVAFTHHTGHELHRNQLIKTVRIWWEQSKGDPELSAPSVKLAQDSDDDGDPAWRQLLGRLPVNGRVTPSYLITTITFIFVVAVAIGSTYVRGQVLEAEATEQHRVEAQGGPSAVPNDPYAAAVPPDLMASQSETDAAVSEQLKDATLKGGWATFIVLAVIFMFLQALGVLLGYKTGFAGKESKKAFKFSRKFNTRDEFEAYHRDKRKLVAQIAQRNLTELQARMAKKLSQTTIDKGMLKTLESGNGRRFLHYVHESNIEHGQHDVNEARARSARDSQLAEVGPAHAAPEPAPASEHAPASDSHGLNEEDIQQWIDKLGWDRQRTIDLLVKQRAKKAQETKPAVSEEDALRMLEEADQ
ncbi:hypothetical protein [Marinobacter sp. F4216]|uniref:hypothetical protein n=1 Tax=Marinobacter sp. F4216 TaxID=2874281 RepID=UPI001CBD90FB|nr:hypothetical protein [Marinobacter sp. F4216]MBZ2169470.1 hypothetical protein [Marinobacter sp. F4216]